MWGDRPSKREVVYRVGHNGVAITLPTDREIHAATTDGGGLIGAEVELFFEAQRAPFIAGAGADIEAFVELLCEADAPDPALGIVEMGPATLDPEIESAWPAGHQEQLGLCTPPAERHGDRNAGA